MDSMDMRLRRTGGDTFGLLRPGGGNAPATPE